MNSLNFLVVVGVPLISLCYNLLWYFIEPDIESLCEIEAKPLIYGEEQCENVFKHNIYVTENALVTVFVAFLSPKIIVRGEIDGKPVYLKKLAKDSEMKLVEKLFKNTFKHFKINKKLIPFIVENLNEMVVSPAFASRDLSIDKFEFCPESNDIRRLLIHLPNFTSFDVYKYLNIWTSLNVNPEPVLLQLLQEPEWPVPKYYGSCGRLAIVEDCGRTVTDHYDSPWEVRVNISIQILEAAFQFTRGHPLLAFYPTDTSPDNFAVNEEGVVKFIDLENVIVVEKFPRNAGDMPNWFTLHTSKYVNCKNCYTYDSSAMCRHWLSDYNIFSVCREILHNTSLLLQGGLLHDSPPDKLSSIVLSYLLEECVKAENKNSRLHSGTMLLRLLKYILNNI